MSRFLFLFLAVFAIQHVKADPQVEQLTWEGTHYWIYRFDPETEEMQMHLPSKKKEPNKFTEVEARVKSSGKKLKFATNAGLYEPFFIPSGLTIAEGKTHVRLNKRSHKKQTPDELTPNFYLMPNGVFFLSAEGKGGILETELYAKTKFTKAESPWLASQSGPLLLDKGKIHPAFNLDSKSRRHRNGVGITADGKLIFACSVQDRVLGLTNFYKFTTLFRDRLGCESALYFDGDISYVYIEGSTPPIRDRNWFAGILTITEKQ
ncbi:MAG: phosphodiester glycosidase family protein [Verrucomicrobiota bacterium]